MITSKCTVLSNGITYVREVYNQNNSINCGLDNGDYFVYAYNCISSAQEPYSISMSWTKVDAVSSFKFTFWIYGFFFMLFCFNICFFPLHDQLPIFGIIAVIYQFLHGIAVIILYCQESKYRESVVEYQKADQIIWSVMNSFIASHLICFVFGFKSAFQDYSSSHTLRILLIFPSSLALNLLSSLSYFYFNLKTFLIISIICIPIALLIELVPFVRKWVRLSRKLKEVCKFLFSKKLVDPNFNINRIYVFFHVHNALGVAMILVQCLTPMYVYFYNLNTDTYIAAAITHLALPELLYSAMSILIGLTYENCDCYPMLNVSTPSNMNDPTPESIEENNNRMAGSVYNIVKSSVNMAVEAYKAAKDAYNNMVSTFPNYPFEPIVPLLDNPQAEEA